MRFLRELDGRIQRVDWKLKILGWGLIALSVWFLTHGQLDAAAISFTNGSALLAQAKWDRKAGASLRDVRIATGLPRQDPNRIEDGTVEPK
jgi:hypothetical protein